MEYESIIEICERYADATLAEFQKLSPGDRDKAGELCYAALQRWLAPEERSSTRHWTGVMMEDGENHVKVRWPYDAEGLAGYIEGLPPGKYRFSLYPVGSKASQFPEVKSPKNLKGAEFEVGDPDERSALAGEAGVGVSMQRLVERQMDGVQSAVDRVADVAERVLVETREERKIADARYDAQHNRMMDMVDRFTNFATGTLGHAEEIAAKGRRSMANAMETERTAVVLKSAAERQIEEANELYEQAEAFLEAKQSSGVTGMLAQLLEHEDGRLMFANFMGNVGDAIKGLVGAGKAEEAREKKRVLTEAANKLGKLGHEQERDELLAQIPDINP